MSRQEEVYKAYLIRSFDELNTIKSSRTYEEVKKKAREYRADMWLEAYFDALYVLGYDFDEMPVDAGEAYAVADSKTAGKTADERLDEYITQYLALQGDLSASDDDVGNVTITPEMLTVIETEAHRAYVSGQMAAAERIEEEKSSYITKTWDATLDDKTREMHVALHGVTIPFGDNFTAANGASGPAPGQMNDPENDCNCRCILAFAEYRA